MSLEPTYTHGVVRIGFKSGREIQFLSVTFAVTKNLAGEISKLEWEDASPEPMRIALLEIDYILFDKGESK